MKKLFVLVTSVVLSLSAFAQDNCADTKDVARILKDQYGERLVYIARVDENKDHIISVWVNDKEKTSTIVKSSAREGISCVVETLHDSKLFSFY
jgi:transcription initiation factor IIE alpha subunit